MHITSLPGRYGIGDLGPAAYHFLDFLKASGHSYWQLLPLNSTDSIYHHSPYSSHSAFAGNQWLISPQLMESEGYINLDDFPLPAGFDPEHVNFEAVEAYKSSLFVAAFNNFVPAGKAGEAFHSFCRKHQNWLDTYTLYTCLRKKFDNQPWSDWPVPLRDRDPEALEAARKELALNIQEQKFIQFLFFTQWERLHNQARQEGIRLFGDVPFYINHDSADCWENPNYFKLDSRKKPTHISGVPPDLFSDTGQLWGTPVYHWKNLKEGGYDWWISRLRQNLLLFDLVRLDHFRAFSAYWEVPAAEQTAINGSWITTPGKKFFEKVQSEFPQMPFIAEDLGLLDQPVFDLLEQFGFAGMKVLQFAFGNRQEDNPYIPYQHLPNQVVYTGTHDNNTTRGWYRNAPKEVRNHLEEYLGRRVRDGEVAQVLHRVALSSVAGLAIIPMQDILELGERAIMNVPGSVTGNWTWRMPPREISRARLEELFALNHLYGRTGKKH